MTLREIEQAIERIGAGLFVGAENIRVGHQLIQRWPNDLTTAAANIKLGVSAFENQRLQFLSVLNRIDHDNTDTAKLHILAGDIDKVIADGNNVAIFALQVRDGIAPCRQPGESVDIARLARATGAISELADSIPERCRNFKFTARTEVVFA